MGKTSTDMSAAKSVSENQACCWMKQGGLVTYDIEKIKVVNTFFTLVFTDKISIQQSETFQTSEKAQKTCPSWSKTGSDNI